MPDSDCVMPGRLRSDGGAESDVTMAKTEKTRKQVEKVLLRAPGAESGGRVRARGARRALGLRGLAAGDAGAGRAGTGAAGARAGGLAG